MRDKTLEGKKLDAYAVLKILKYCTNSPARSYQCKFAMEETFKNKDISNMGDVGAAIMDIIQFRTIHGKFSSVHPDLFASGIVGVDVGDEGLIFNHSQAGGLLHYFNSME